MKTTLTLKSTAFYFLQNLNLIKNQSVEVETDDLSTVELKGLRKQVRNGCIDSTKDLSEVFESLDKEEQPGTAVLQEEVNKVEVVEDTQEETQEIQEDTQEDTQETQEDTQEETQEEIQETGEEDTQEEATDYSEWLKRDLKAELDKREISYESNSSNKVLQGLLKEDDNK